ncbi:MAG TPA: MlrC C-terminal domain-containing protein, partial [Caulobacteraceae bacterium]|nr:MlrC C-terminal domain-containing protein [Caulobacteraceae bacterium]
VDLEGKRMVVVKSSRHFETGFALIADLVLPVATPGTLQMDFASLPYVKKRDMDYYPRVRDPLGLG